MWDLRLRCWWIILLCFDYNRKMKEHLNAKVWRIAHLYLYECLIRSLKSCVFRVSNLQVFLLTVQISYQSRDALKWFGKSDYNIFCTTLLCHYHLCWSALHVSAMSLLSIHEPAMYKSPASSSSSVSPVTQDTATVRIDLSRWVAYAFIIGIIGLRGHYLKNVNFAGENRKIQSL